MRSKVKKRTVKGARRRQARRETMKVGLSREDAHSDQRGLLTSNGLPAGPGKSGNTLLPGILPTM